MNNIKSIEENISSINLTDLHTNDLEISDLNLHSENATNQDEESKQNDKSDKQTDELTPEDIKLGGSPPLKTIFKLSVGPLLSQVTNGLYGIIISIWISKTIGEDGLSAVSTMNAFDGIG